MNKYGAKKSVFKGVTYDSKLERDMAITLNDLVKKKLIQSVDTQHCIKVKLNEKLICTHKVDFYITMNDGRTKFVESKGVPTAVWKLKRKMVEALHADIPYLVNPTKKQILD